MNNALHTEESGHVEISGEEATVSFERRYARPRREVWRALTEPAQLAMWLDEAEIDLRVGGRFEIHFGDAPMVGSITALEPERLLSYSWHEGRDDESNVRWELSDDGTGTLVRLVHTRLASRSAPGFAAGWHHHLERLEALLSGSRAEWSDARFGQLRDGYEATGT